jgi:predicted YcjX-like family ATPase
LLDLPLLGKSYEQWSAETLAHLRQTARHPQPKVFLDRVASIDPLGSADEYAAIEAARLFTDHLQAGRQEHRTLSVVGPGRFLMPGDLAGSPALTFAPLAVPADGEPPPGSVWSMMHRRYEAYRDAVVRPFFRDHFARIDRQIILVDVLLALDAGPEAIRDLQDAMVAVLGCFRIGRGGWLSTLFSPRADRILFAATKADQVHHSAHDRLEAILKQMTEGAIARAGDAGAEVDVIALAAIRATREALFRGDAGGLPSIVGTAAPGEWSDGRHFDGRTEMAFFPGDLPEQNLQGGDFRSIRFRPPMLEETDEGIPALPHIRLDRALQFLIGDRLR